MSENRIKSAREDAGLSQGDLAKILKVTRQTISAYERGQREPRLDTWQSLADALSVSVPYLQGVSSDPVGIDEVAKSGMTVRDYKKFLAEFKQGDRTPEEAEQLLSALRKTLDTQNVLEDLRTRALSQLVKSIENLKLDKMRYFEMINIDDAINLCIGFNETFGDDNRLSSSFSALLSGLRAITKRDRSVNYDKAEFMNAFEQFLDTVVAKHD